MLDASEEAKKKQARAERFGVAAVGREEGIVYALREGGNVATGK